MTDPNWLQLRLVAQRERAEAIELALQAAGALAVTLDDPGNTPILEPDPQQQPLWDQVRVTALFADDDDGREQAELAAAILKHQVQAPIPIEPLAHRPWERVWLDAARPMRFGERLWVCPRGQRPQPEPDGSPIVVELDPGLAFGTGHHPTTALCLRWLDQAPLAGRTLIDYGCGSGILAIAALALGARRAIAVDHDPQALEATRANAADNRVGERITVCAPDAFPDQPADLLIANILAGPLIELAPRLTALTAPSGLIALSGLLAEQGTQTARAYANTVALQPPWEQDGWLLLHGRRLRAPGLGSH